MADTTYRIVHREDDSFAVEIKRVGALPQTAAGFATDAIELLGPDFRMTGRFARPFGTPLPSRRRQHEVGCVALQSLPLAVSPGYPARVSFFGVFAADHPAASGEADLAPVEAVARRHGHIVVEALAPAAPPLRPGQSLV